MDVNAANKTKTYGADGSDADPWTFSGFVNGDTAGVSGRGRVTALCSYAAHSANAG